MRHHPKSPLRTADLNNGKLKTIFNTGQHTTLGKINDLCYGMPYGQQVIVNPEILSDSSLKDSPGWGAYIYDLEDNFLVPFVTKSTPIPGRENHLSHLLPAHPHAQKRHSLHPCPSPTIRQTSGSLRGVVQRARRHLQSRLHQRGRALRRRPVQIEKILDTLYTTNLSRRSREHLSKLSAEELENFKSERRLISPFSIYTIAASDTVWATLCTTADGAEHILIHTPRVFQILVDTDTAIPDMFEGTFTNSANTASIL